MVNLIITSFPEAFSSQNLKQKLLPCEFWNPESDPDPKEDYDLIYNRYIWLSYKLSHLERIYQWFPQALNLPENPLVFYDKWEQFLWLQKLNVSTLPTFLPVKSLGGFPLVVKPRLGMKGYKVHVINDQRTYESFLEEKDYEYIIQPWLPIDREVRLLIEAGEVLGAWDKQSWKSVGETPDYENIKEQVDEQGAYFYALDFFQIEGHWVLNEVNLNPGWKNLALETSKEFFSPIKKPVTRTGSLK